MPITATGLNASVTTAISQTTISSSAYNSNITNLNDALNPTFQTLGVAGAVEIDGSLTIMATMLNSTGGAIMTASGHGTLRVKHTISASGTITHGLGYTPSDINTETNVSGSQSTGHDTVGSTTYHVTLASSLASDSMAG